MKKTPVKKIIISSYDDQKNPVYSGGGAYSVHQLAKRLAKKYEVTVLTGTYKNAKNEIIDSVEYIRIGSDIFGHKIGQLIYQYSLLKHAAKKKYDVWIESTTPPFTFSLLPLFCKKPVISWVNMLCSLDMQRKYKLNFRAIEQELCKLYKYIIVPTDWVKKEVMAMNKKAKAFIITPGIEQEIPQETLKKIPGLGNYLLFIGRIEVNQKGLDLLIQALPFTNKRTQVVIAGSGSKQEEDKLSDLITQYGVVKKIKRVGRIEGQQKKTLLENAKAVIVLSRFETLSLAALESITHQKHIICFDIPQLQWIPEKFALKITPFNQKKLAQAIDEVYSAKITKKISASEKKEFMKKYDWEETTHKFQDCISQVTL